MSQGILMVILAVVAVALLGLVMRRATAPPVTETIPAPPEPDPEPYEDEPEAGEPADALAVTSDGWSFMPIEDRDRVRLIPPVVPPAIGPVQTRPAPEQLARGDLIGARVKRGVPDHDPWRLEALGRDGEYRAWRFETEEAARAALALVDRCIVRAPRDPDGAEVAVGDADFVEARRREEEIESELATMTDVEERPEGPPPRPFE
ncbi:MAG: hypothetical protein ACRENJ_12010 [Candidatus Eiseniibacteriota bacterium]